VADLTVVLDAVGSERAVLGGAMEGGAPNVLFAASDPERVHPLFWWYPTARESRSSDYPFGSSEEILDRFEEDTEAHWGTDAYTFGDLQASGTGTEPIRWGWLSRQTTTPDVAVEMVRMMRGTDVRGVMPAITSPSCSCLANATARRSCTWRRCYASRGSACSRGRTC
jgi:hypothetical protein